MSEEFQESDIIFSDQSKIQKTKLFNTRNDEKKSIRWREAAEKTTPVRISTNNFRFSEWDTTEEEEEDKTPPHVIIERRMKEQIAFSVCTLKGRDLSRHRNSVLRMTGFLEA
ncbi:Senescence regulator S40 [Arabidopsis suecica]|uniref:Senescence regulator S40 n=1 Tax=Arabidopsis suecica TaxID=45249 RepID=A0A8T1XPJ2_ARASU|nr:Senescence regulator S40 [Arabidopsis suecica]